LFVTLPSFSRNRQKRRSRNERIEIKNMGKNHLPTSELRGKDNYGRFPFGSKTKFSRNLSRSLPSSPIFLMEFGRLGLPKLAEGRSAYPKCRRKACPTLPTNRPPASSAWPRQKPGRQVRTVKRASAVHSERAPGKGKRTATGALKNRLYADKPRLARRPQRRARTTPWKPGVITNQT